MNKPVVANSDKLSNLKNLLEKSKGSIAKTLPAHMSAERMVKIAVVAASRNPTLLQCEPLSLLSALMEASQLGLEPFTGLQQAYIIPYKLKRGDKEYHEAQFMPSYRGLIDLARRSGNIVSIEAHCVYEHDEFELELGSNRKLKHIPKLDGDRGKMKLVYAVAVLKDGGTQFEFLTLADIAKIKSCSRAGSGPWNQWHDSMCRKSAIKRLCKYLPVSVDLARAISKDNALEGDFETDVFDVDSIDIESVGVAEQVSASEELAKNLQG